MRCVLDAGARLGEGPIWASEEAVLYWADSMAQSLNRFDPATGARQCWPVPDLIGSFALCRTGGALLALRRGLAVLDFESGVVRTVKDFALAERDNRFNDGKCDRRGRFWAGTMHFAGLPRQPRGRLYRFEPDLSHAVRETGIRTSNGIGWSPDDRTMYFTDTRVSRIHAYDYDIETGANTRRRDFAVVPEETGYPDGLTVDSAGYVWSVNWGGGRVVRWGRRRVPCRRRGVLPAGGGAFGSGAPDTRGTHKDHQADHRRPHGAEITPSGVARKPHRGQALIRPRPCAPCTSVRPPGVASGGKCGRRAASGRSRSRSCRRSARGY